MQDFVVRKKDGYPAYQLTSVIDDLLFGVDLVVRGQDLWASTLAQLYVTLKLKADGFRDITFHHHPLLTKSSGAKLSKSAGATSVKYLREQGKKPADVYSAIGAMLGNNETIENWKQLALLIEIAT
jgi:glutamyl-tRNA synthetase